jgi:hypothetical protein
MGVVRYEEDNMDTEVSQSFLDNTGRLLEKYKPGIYMDTSLLVDYWISEAFDAPIDPFHEDLKHRDSVEQMNQKLIDVLKGEDRYKKAFKLRNKLYERIFGWKQQSAYIYTSPLAVFELVQWNARSEFKYLATAAAGSPVVENMSVKNVGKYIDVLLSEYAEECLKHENTKNESFYGSPLHLLYCSLSIVPSFAESHGLLGIDVLDIIKFDFSYKHLWDEGNQLAMRQIGGADWMHLLLASHFGCEYIATKDEDFSRAKGVLERHGLKLLMGFDQVLEILN